ncbi:MAG: hypothetical protein HQM09_13615 [Candidatus Riflebacteria bacterium]|nr:hypothetical protein [Candidatus Riflebacteria bacterium]
MDELAVNKNNGDSVDSGEVISRWHRKGNSEWKRDPIIYNENAVDTNFPLNILGISVIGLGALGVLSFAMIPTFGSNATSWSDSNGKPILQQLKNCRIVSQENSSRDATTFHRS